MAVRVLNFSFQQISEISKVIYSGKICTNLPFTIKNKRKNTNLKFDFKNYCIFTPEKAHFWFLKKKNTDQNIICVSFVFKTITNKKYEEFLNFYFKIQKCTFLGVAKFLIFFYVFAFETIEAQMFFW